jgi:hypothetical protein
LPPRVLKLDILVFEKFATNTDEETEALKLKLKLKALFYKKMTEANDAESEPGLSDDSISSPTVVIIGKFTCEERPHRKN